LTKDVSTSFGELRSKIGSS